MYVHDLSHVVIANTIMYMSDICKGRITQLNKSIHYHIILLPVYESIVQCVIFLSM